MSKTTTSEKNPVGRPLKYKSAAEMQKVIDRYFDTCDKEGRPYTVTGLAMELDLDRKALINYAEKDEFSNTIKKAKRRVERYIEEHMYSANVTGLIFNLKNNFGWVDRQEIEQHNTFDFGSATLTDED